ncbi:hypothetical protein B0H17DRAFT_1196447 [Mycena rosella]|uniref:Uncharacterized protein n=1 Tax=Mycena rosella TaxID=1033263 RepID=A0AAD7DTJ3_MYCRO|nr:hypothetical protein B0H17DRAFT_1196447 [Mycena rosella]
MGSISPPDLEYRRPVDLHADAVRLCIALQSQLSPAFLGAAKDLLSCGALPPAEFRKHSRKIIRLIEPKYTYKAVYFDLLRMLHARRCDVDAALQARTNALLVRLFSNFVGRDSAAAPQVMPTRIQLPDKSRQTLAMGITTCTPQPPNSPALCTHMPPPDAFPPSPSPAPSPRHRKFKRPRRSLFPEPVPEVATRPRKRARVAADRENQSPGPASAPTPATYAYKAPPLTKRFGIFCTGKTSMHRPRSVRAC